MVCQSEWSFVPRALEECRQVWARGLRYAKRAWQELRRLSIIARPMSCTLNPAQNLGVEKESWCRHSKSDVAGSLEKSGCGEGNMGTVKTVE